MEEAAQTPSAPPAPGASGLRTASAGSSARGSSSEPGAGSATGVGLASYDRSGRVLDVYFPAPVLGTDPPQVPTGLADLAGTDPDRNIRTELVVVTSKLDQPPEDAADAYLRLHLLSHRLVAPHGCSLEGLFRVLSTVVWTTAGPCAVDGFETVRTRLRGRGQVTVLSVDKIPRMVDYVLPTGVRVADADRVRLGAHLAPGTTVMHEGFVNYNAGTLGASMVEGRISAGVVVGDGSDIGGGASIMGTLSGGGTRIIRIGRGCLVGANAGVGISLGDGCVVEAGCYVTAGSKITMPDGSVHRASELSGVDGLLFRRNSLTGALQALPRSGDWAGLNPDLHAN